MAYCETCGAKVKDDAAFCRRCGAAQPSATRAPSRSATPTASEVEVASPNPRAATRKWLLLGVVGLAVVGAVGTFVLVTHGGGNRLGSAPAGWVTRKTDFGFNYSAPSDWTEVASGPAGFTIRNRERTGRVGFSNGETAAMDSEARMAFIRKQAANRTAIRVDNGPNEVSFLGQRGLALASSVPSGGGFIQITGPTYVIEAFADNALEQEQIVGILKSMGIIGDIGFR